MICSLLQSELWRREEKKMKTFLNVLQKAIVFFVLCTIICGGLYTFAVTGIAQALFPNQANGSIIEVDGKKYGSELIGQAFVGEEHMWGRVTDGSPSNLSPASEEYEELVADRVKKIKESHPDQQENQVPVDLVTGSGSGLDPHISVAAANYQIGRLVENTSYSETEIKKIIEDCTTERFLNIFGEPTVNVLEVNLMLDGILKS